MIRIVRGPSSHLHAYFSSLATQSPKALWWVRQPGPLRSWDGFRGFLVQLEDQVGRDAVDGVLARDPAIAGLLVARFRDLADADQERRRATLAASPESHLTHNWAMQRPFLEAWSDLLVDLLELETENGQAPWHLLLPDLGALDRQSQRLLQTALRRHLDRMPPLTVGFDPERRPAFDPTGLLLEPGWSDLVRTFAGFQSLPGAETTELDGTDAPSSVGTLPKTAESSYDAVEAEAAQLLSQDAALTAAERRTVVEAVRLAFANFGYGAAIRLGSALLTRGEDLTREEAADVHTAIALACHNRQFKTSHAGPDLVQFMEEHLRSAVEHEDRVAHRCALLYRLAVNVGRRQKRFAEAKVSTDRAIADVASLPPREAAYQEAWALNIRAFLNFRLGDIEQGIQDADRALHLLGEAKDREPESIDSTENRWPRDLTFSQAVVAHNRANVSFYLGDQEEGQRLRALANEIDADFDGIETLEAFPWVEAYRRAGRLDLALERARSGLESATREKDPWSEYFYNTVVADLELRRGRAAEAAECFEAARTLRTRLGNPIYLTPLELPHAHALTLAGSPEAARALYTEALERIGETLDPRAQVLAALGLLAAREGEGDEAEQRINDAIEVAVASGELVTLVRTAIAAGQACRLLDRREDALAAYRQADDLLTEGDEIPLEDRISLWVGLLSSGSADHQLAGRVLEALSEALAEATTWEEIPPFAAYLSSHPEALEGASPEALDAFHNAVAQRQDLTP